MLPNFKEPHGLNTTQLFWTPAEGHISVFQAWSELLGYTSTEQPCRTASQVLAGSSEHITNKANRLFSIIQEW